MRQIDARLLVGLRGPDLVASTARLALVQKMGFAGRLAGLRRYDFFHLILETRGEPGATIDALQRTLARQSTFYNRNKHMYSLECRWDGGSRVEGPSHEELYHFFGQTLGKNPDRDGPRAGTGVNFDGKRGSGVANVKEYPSFLVEVTVQDDDPAGRDAIASRLKRELSGLPGGDVEVQCPGRATVWWLAIAAPDETAAMETARQITVTTRRDEGLLMNPNYQRAEFVSGGRIDPVHS